MKILHQSSLMRLVILTFQLSLWVAPNAVLASDVWPVIKSHLTSNLTSELTSKLLAMDCLRSVLDTLDLRNALPQERWSIEASPSYLENLSTIQLGAQKLQNEIAARRARVSEFQFVRQEAQRRGLRVWLFGGTAAGFSHYVKWDVLRESGDSRFQPDRFDYDYTNIFRSTQDLDLVVDGSAQAAHEFELELKRRFPYFLGSKAADWEVRSLREPRKDHGSLLGDYGFMNQHTDSNSTGMIELTDPPTGESVVRDIRAWNSTGDSPFLKDLSEGTLTFYYSPRHRNTPRAKAGKNPPIFSVIRALTKAFQYNLRIKDDDLAILQKEIRRFHPKNDLAESYAIHWIEKNGTKLLQHAVDLEYAWNTLEKLGLRSKLISIRNDPRFMGSLSWWLSKEPLRRKPIGVGTGRTAESLGLKTVAHETMSFLAYESITRSHTGAPNVFISRMNVPGESAAYGEGFYTSVGKRGARGSGITIRFTVDPRAREGTDFILSRPQLKDSDQELPEATYVIWKNKNAIRVIPESLNLSPLEYFLFLAQGKDIQLEDQALLWKLKRRLDQSVISGKIPPEELEQIHLLVLENLQSESSSSLLFREWLKLQAKRMQKSESEVNAVLDSLATATYRADPIPVFSFLMEMARDTPIKRYFSDVWLPSVLSTMKLDISNRALEHCLFSNFPHVNDVMKLRDFGKMVLKKRKDDLSDVFPRALQSILDFKGDLALWLKTSSRNFNQIKEKAAYLAHHPELRSLIDPEEWSRLEPELKAVSQIQLFEKVPDRAWPTGLIGESFQFKAFDFPPGGKKVKLGAPSYYSNHSSGEVEVEIILTKPFQLQLTPVTQFQWTWIMGANPSRFSKGGQRVRVDEQEIEMNPNYPVENVSWEEVQIYIQKLNSIDPDYQYRLPTDAEWEYATRGESQTAYFFGDDYIELMEYGWFLNNAMGHTHEVATLKPNSFGLYDVHGNVSEWMQDWWSPLPRAHHSVDPTGPEIGSYRVTRGGSWADSALRLRSSLKNTQGPNISTDFTGFRLVRIPRKID